MSKREQYAPEFKAKVALEALKGDETARNPRCRFCALPWYHLPEDRRTSQFNSALLSGPRVPLQGRTHLSTFPDRPETTKNNTTGLPDTCRNSPIFRRIMYEVETRF